MEPGRGEWGTTLEHEDKSGAESVGQTSVLKHEDTIGQTSSGKQCAGEKNAEEGEGPEAGLTTELKKEVTLKTELKHEAGPKTEVVPEAGLKTELKIEAGPKTELKHESGPKTELKQEVGPKTELQTEAGLKAGLKVEGDDGDRAKDMANMGTSIEGQTGELAGGASGEPGVLLLLAKTLKEAYKAETSVRDSAPNLPDGLRLFFGGEVGREEKAEFEAEFDGSAYLNNLESVSLGRTVLVASRLPSTHSLLSQNFKSFPVGTVCVSDVQYEGRGRGGNKWQSPLGCLLFSFSLREANGRTLPFLQYTASLAVVQAIEVVSFGKGLSKPLEVRIKWPNDLYARGLKLGGVLCTSTYSGGRFNVVVGCGLNVANREPTTCLNALLEEQSPGAEPITREELLAAIIGRFEELHQSFTAKGFEELQEPYLQRWLHTDQRVVLEEDGAAGEGPSKVHLTVKGLTSSGYLLAVDDAGESFELHPDGNSFDFFKGLVRKKLPEPSV